MTPLDDRLSQAVTDLRGEMEALPTPPFTPKRPAGSAAILALVVLVGLGFVVASYARTGSDDRGGVAVATQPEPADIAEAEPEPASDPVVLTGQFTTAEAGEFLLALPAGVAWNPDESRLLMYRTGEVDPGHYIVESATGQTISAEPMPITPADIEQVYWDPRESDAVLYTSGAEVIAYNPSVGQARVQASFDGCDQVDSGVLPVPPASNGTFSLLCHSGEQRELLVYDLDTRESLRAPTTGDTAALPSESGRYFVRSNSDGSASVLDASLVETGVTLDVDNNVFVLVADDEGREWAATTLFDGPAVGSIVLLPLDGASDPVVVIGPDRGDPYPPSGTSISAGGGVVAVSIPGDDDGELVGRITAVDVGNVLSPTVELSVAHGSTQRHNYWSRPFISVSPSGEFIAYSSDSASDRVDTFIVALPDFG